MVLGSPLLDLGPVLAQHVVGLVFRLLEGLHPLEDQLDLDELAVAELVGLEEDELDVLLGDLELRFCQVGVLQLGFLVCLGPAVLDLEEFELGVLFEYFWYLFYEIKGIFCVG